MLGTSEQKIEKLILKWKNSIVSNKDLSQWLNKRMWQEDHQDREVSFLEKLIPDIKNKKILDLGSGMGGFLVAMRRRGYNILGLEINPDYCDITELRGKRYNLDIKVIKAAGENIPLKSEMFDFIYCNDVLEHSIDPDKVLKESFRVLKNTGQMYVTIINRFGFKDPHYKLFFINWMPRKIAQNILRFIKMRKCDSLAGRQELSTMHYFTFREIKKIAELNGFRVIDLGEYKIKNPNLISDVKKKKMLKILNSTGTVLVFYKFIRFFYMGGFKLLLKK